MSDGTKIAWTDATWNPVRGCTPISAGCAHCYARTFAERWRGIKGHPFEHGFDVRLVPEKLGEPLRWKKPRSVFVNSMSDLFHEAVPFEYVAAVFGVMVACPQHTFQVLTKRPARMLEFFRWLDALACVIPEGDMEVRICLGQADKTVARPFHVVYPSWPLPNVWLGVTVEDQRAADERIPLLLQTPAAVRFLSCEPLLEAVDLERLARPGGGTRTGFSEWSEDGPDLHWVIVGGESGTKARPCDLAWIRSIVGQCREAEVPVFVKQMGAKPAGSWSSPLGLDRHDYWRLKDRAGRDPSEWPKDLRRQEFPEVRP